jgi:carbon storage regulator CsrA
MLVLSRKTHQSILIRGKGGDIRVVALEAEKGRLRLGIEAPSGYTIIREELLGEIRDANRQSAVEGTDAIRKVLGDNNE